MKNKNTISSFLTSTSQQKVIKFLCAHINQEFYDAQIAREIQDISKASVNNALHDLHAVGIIGRRYLGNIAMNTINTQNPVIKQYKIALTVSDISLLLSTIQSYCTEITMFGNASIGQNNIEDKIDLFIVTEHVRTVEKLIKNNSIGHKINFIIHTAKQVRMFQKEAPVFFESINNGLKLF